MLTPMMPMAMPTTMPMPILPKAMAMARLTHRLPMAMPMLMTDVRTVMHWGCADERAYRRVCRCAGVR